MKTAAIYCRVSTDDQSCERQARELLAYAEKQGYQLYKQPFIETASGAKNDRKLRAEIIKAARNKEIDVILVTELTRWGRSLPDLLATLQELETRQVALVPLNGMAFDFSTAQGKLMGTIMAAFSEFERDLIRERTKSGLAAAKARGKQIGRRKGDCWVVDKYKLRALRLKEDGMSVRNIAESLNISPTTVQKILKEGRG